VGGGVTASFTGAGFFNKFTNCEYADLNIDETFLCSPRTNYPPHEPSGALLAARFFPLVHYELTPNPKLDKRSPFTRLRSLRFDYRLQLYIDRHHELKTNETLKQLSNQAGLFADSDSSMMTALKTIAAGLLQFELSGSLSTARPMTIGAFTAIEKPLVLEVIAPALGAGFPVFEATDKASGKKATVRAWDNVHWWGARGLASGEVISAPGAFHCAHLHWRWGEAAKLGPAGVSKNLAFNPNTWPSGMSPPAGVNGMWGPLLDPGVWMQTLRVAIALNEKSLDPAAGATAAKMTRSDWESMFTGLRNKPKPIGSGADIVLWFSTQVLQYVTVGSGTAARTYRAAPKATLFIHGLFFAHDAEVSSFFVGSTNPAYWPRSETDIKTAGNWVRVAS
jgi:hypothetical protein